PDSVDEGAEPLLRLGDGRGLHEPDRIDPSSHYGGETRSAAASRSVRSRERAPRERLVRRLSEPIGPVPEIRDRSSPERPRLASIHAVIFGSPASAAFTCSLGYSKSSSLPIM